MHAILTDFLYERGKTQFRKVVFSLLGRRNTDSLSSHRSQAHTRIHKLLALTPRKHLQQYQLN